MTGYNQGQRLVDPKAQGMKTYRVNHGFSELSETASEWLYLNNRGSRISKCQKFLNKRLYGR